MPKKICKPIPILKTGELTRDSRNKNNLNLAFLIQKNFTKGKSHTISLTQEQCASILANAFFCTFPDRHGKHNPEAMPFINFNG